MTYAELKAAVNDWLARSDLTDANADLFIDLAEARINRSLRIRAMETVYNETLDTEGTTTYPSTVLEFKHLFLIDADDPDALAISGSTAGVQSLADTNAVYPLEWRGAFELGANFETYRSSGGAPRYAARHGDRIYYWPLSTDEGYTAAGIYYAKFTALSDDATTNWLTDNAPDLLLAGALLEASAYVKSPDQFGFWSARFDRALSELQRSDERQEFSATPMVSRVASRCRP